MPDEPTDRKTPERPTRQPWRERHELIVRLNTIEAEPVQWLSPGRLAADKLTILDGETPPSTGGGHGGE